MIVIIFSDLICVGNNIDNVYVYSFFYFKYNLGGICFF